MSFYLPRELEKSPEERYEGYGRRCRSQGIDPLPFRSWALVDAAFDIEWTAAKLEYGEALVELDGEGE